VNNSFLVNVTILVGVSQGITKAPFLYSIFAHNTPKSFYTSLGTYTDDTVIFASNNIPQIVPERLQNHLKISVFQFY